MFKKFFLNFKIIFYFANLIIITLYIFPGSLLGWLLYGDVYIQPKISPDFIVSSNHVYAFSVLTILGYLSYKSRKLKLEKSEITKHLKKEDCVVILDKAGKHISSKEFSEFLELKMKNRIKRVCFIIGSEIGMDDSLKKGENIFSFGKQTWPHLMVRIMLIEQIYRSLEILKGTSYHK